MDPESPDQHLSRISTSWTLFQQAHQGPAEAIHEAQRQLLDRYSGAVRRYLHGAVRQRDAADELFQEFALRFLRGSLRGADPGRGRFRDFLKGVLYHLVADYHKSRQRTPWPLPPDAQPAVEPESVADSDRQFLAHWRDELLARGWTALERAESTSGQPWYTVLRFRANHPELSSAEMAEQLGGRLGKALTAPGVRQILHRAREKFADQLLEDVIQSLQEPTPQAIEEELLELNLLDYCRPALQRRNPEG